MPLIPRQAPAPVTPPPTPQAPPSPAFVITQPVLAPNSVTQWTIPRTAAERAILHAQRAALSSQIENVRDRRNTIARAYERSSGASRAGLEQQLRFLDGRIMQLEQDLAESGRAYYQSTAMSTSTGMPFPIGNLSNGQVTGIFVVFILFVLGPLAGSLGRLMWRRSAKPATPPGWGDAAQRLERLEHAVDTIAI